MAVCVPVEVDVPGAVAVDVISGVREGVDVIEEVTVVAGVFEEVLEPVCVTVFVAVWEGVTVTRAVIL